MKIININKVIREITILADECWRYNTNTQVYKAGLNRAIQIIKDNIKEIPEEPSDDLLTKYNDNEYIQRYSRKTDKRVT